MEDNVEKIKIDQEKAAGAAKEISEAYLGKAQEKTIAHYFDQISSCLQRELGVKPPHSPKKVAEESVLDQYYLSEDSLELKRAAEDFASKIEIVGLNLIQLKQQFKT